MPNSQTVVRFIIATMLLFSVTWFGCQPSSSQSSKSKETSMKSEVAEPQVETPAHSKTVYDWTPLFDGKSMGDWQIIRFTGNDQASVEDGKIVLEMGYPLAGISFQSESTQLPTTNYELELQAMKVDGTDFFCCLTFPVGDQFCSLVLGGWGGTVSGISCIDGDDASSNKTKTIRKYEKGTWYTIRVCVSNDQLDCWIDDLPIVDLPLTGIELSLRTEVTQCKPLSLCSFSTTAAYRNIRFRKLPETDESNSK